MYKRKCLLTYISIFCLAIISSQVFAFGADGHRAVTKIAENHLSEKTATAIRAITNNADLSELSLWPDQIRGIPKWKKSKYWHYMNIADHESLETAKRSSKGDVLSALNHYYKQLNDSRLPDSERRQALSFFIHFAADIHQPLHVGRRDDRGGNSIAVKWPKKSRQKNLHWVWDSGLINSSKLSIEDYAEKLDSANKQQIHRWQQDSFLDWAVESKMLRTQVYEFGLKIPTEKLAKKPLSISQDYINRNKPIVEKRLLMAGIRIAGQLNKIFDPLHNDPLSADK
jgi:hypothetical protein